MDLQILNAVVKELSVLLTGARIDRVYEGPARGIYFLLTLNRKHFILLLSPDRSLPRLHLVSKKETVSAAPNRFSLYLRSHLSATRIENISVVNEDRIVEIVFSGTISRYRLIFELFGPALNMVIADEGSKILAVYFPATDDGRGKRILLPGIEYIAPVNKNRAYSPETPSPVTAPIQGNEGFEEVSPNRAAELYYESLLEKRLINSLRSEIQSVLNKIGGRLKRRINALERDKKSAENSEAFRRMGDLILANLNRIEPGAAQAELAWHDGTKSNVALDPRRSASRNAALYFKKYKKAKAGKEIILSRLNEAEAEYAEVAAFSAAIENSDHESELNSVWSRLAGKGYLRREKGEKKGPSAPADQPSYRVVLHEGWQILIGKSAAGNDYVTMKIARDSDVWLHAEGIPGSHVIVKNRDGKEIPPEVISKAASLAAFHSRGRSAGKVPVTYTFARNVKKPKGAKPGLVTITGRKTIIAAPEER